MPAACRSHGTYWEATEPALTSSFVVPPEPPPPVPLPTATGFQVCADEPLQVQSWICVPLAVARPFTSTHFALVRPTILLNPLDATNLKSCPPELLQVHSSIFVPFAVALPVTSTHFPLLGLTSLKKPLVTALSTRKICAAVALQAHSWILVPLAVPAAFTSMQLFVSWGSLKLYWVPAVTR